MKNYHPKDSHWQSRLAAIEGRPEPEPECSMCSEMEQDIERLRAALEGMVEMFGEAEPVNDWTATVKARAALEAGKA